MKSQKTTEPHVAIRRRKVSSMPLRGMRTPSRSSRRSSRAGKPSRTPRRTSPARTSRSPATSSHDAPLLSIGAKRTSSGRFRSEMKGNHPVAELREANKRAAACC